jgi:glutaryl-CoA dehydrogenase
MKPDLFQSPDYYNLDDLLTDEHKLVRDSARAWVKREVSPIIEEYAKAEFPKQILKGLADIGGFGPYIPERIWWSWIRPNLLRIMQEIERGDSGSTFYFFGSIVFSYVPYLEIW